MRYSFRVKTCACTISIVFALALASKSSVHASSSAGGVNCVLKELQRDFSQSPAPGIAPRVAIEKLTSEIAARRARVPEFEFIRKEGEKRGLRVWLFGGTAAGYGHYVKWDILREAGDLRFQKDRFDYDYTNIYRSTQDLDIVVDGSAAQAQEFQQALKTQFPYFVGSKATPWEVRSLRESSGDKGAILDDFGFMNQHTDSNSTGMIELTDPPNGESVVRDVRDWKKIEDSQFLKDLHADQLTYYFSPTHEQTSRAKEGKNPPIFSVVRALTKAFQYDLKIRDEDLAIMKRVIDDFNPSRDLRTADAQHWLEKNGKKLYQHAVDIEYASQTLDQLGLKRKLIATKNNPGEQDSLAWWMSKEPLKTGPVGEGSGKTAKELGIDIVAHETNNFLAYESITRAHTGEPNVLISRDDAVGEAAAYGSGFYTRIGTKGARGTGITIRFRADPNAREGKDFTRSGEYVVWQTKNAIRVIPESLEMSPSQYFEFLADGKMISRDDTALMWKLKRKLDHRFASGLADPAELRKIRTLMMEKVKVQAPNHELLFQEWIKLEEARIGKPSHLVDELAEWIKTHHVADPASTAEELAHLAHGTEIETWIDLEYIPFLLRSLKPDVGDRVIENALSSSRADVRAFGLRALDHAEKGLPSRRILHLRKLVQEKADTPIDRAAAQAWLREDLEKHSSRPVFEKLAQNDAAALALLKRARPESFQFQQFGIPAGGRKARLGSPGNEIGHSRDEELREVVLTKAFEMQTTPVTQLQWVLVMGQGNPKFENPAYFRAGGEILNGVPLNPNRPVERVSWNDAQEFIKKLNELDSHYQYRLPTEAEWEVSARAGTNTAYSFGKDATELSQYAWHQGNSGVQTHDVASLKPNPAGLYDMHGHVWEWVEDVYWDPPPEGLDPLANSRGFRVLRGGDYYGEPNELRSAHRMSERPDVPLYGVGLRLVRIPKRP